MASSKKIKIGVYVVASVPAIVHDGVSGSGADCNPQGIENIRKFVSRCDQIEKFGFSTGSHCDRDGRSRDEITLSDYWINVRCFLPGDDLTHTHPLIPHTHPLHKLVALPSIFPLPHMLDIAAGEVTTSVKLNDTEHTLVWYPSQESSTLRAGMMVAINRALRMCKRGRPDDAKAAYELYKTLWTKWSYCGNVV